MLLLLLAACWRGESIAIVGRPPEPWDSGAVQGQDTTLRGGQARSWRIVVDAEPQPATTHLFVDAELTDLRGTTTLSAELRDWEDQVLDTESEPAAQGVLLTTEALDLLDGLCPEVRCELSLTYTLALEGDGNVALSVRPELTQPFGDGGTAGILLIEELTEGR